MIDKDRKAKEERLDILRTAPPCNGVVQLLRNKLSLPIIVTPVDLPSLTRGEVGEIMQLFWKLHPPTPIEVEEEVVKEPVLSENARKLLMLIASKPNLYSSHYYNELCWSLATGTRNRGKLEDGKFIRIHRIKTGRRGGKPEIIELLPLAYETIGLKKPQPRGHGSFEHSWWCSKISFWLEVNGHA